MSVRVLICGGGTGGHIYPALQVSQSLFAVLNEGTRPLVREVPALDQGGDPEALRSASDLTLLYVGADSELDRRIVGDAGVPFIGLDVGGIRGKRLVTAAINLLRHAVALPRALALVRRFRPDVVLVAGGYVCVPVALAAWLLRVPLVVMTVDIVPGWAISFTCRLGTVVTAAFPEALAHLPRPLGGGGRMVLAGYPLRTEFRSVNRPEARASLGLGVDEPLLVVFGGSQGARRINFALQEALPTLLPEVRIVHVTGRRDAESLAVARQALPDHLSDRYTQYPYLDAVEMARVLAAADVAVCRSGAGAIAELAAVGLPAVLVPGEFSHQDLNAHYMAEQGAAITVPDAALDADTLAQAVLGLLHDRCRLAAMVEASRALARPDAADRIARVVLTTAGYGMALPPGEA